MIEVTDFQADVLEREGTYLLFFHADWAPPSIKLLKDLKGFDVLPVLAVDVDAQPKATSYMDVRAVPMLFLMEGGTPVRHKIGYHPTETILGLLEVE